MHLLLLGSLLEDGGYFDDERDVEKYITYIVKTIYGNTVKNIKVDSGDYDFDEEEEETENPEKEEKKQDYWVSEDRAKFIAENEANTICNNQEYYEAVKAGKTHKIWMAFPDNRVRFTHEEANGSEIPIKDYFSVGRARMLFPKDLTSKYSTAEECPEEVINCRCTVKYI